MKNYDELYDKDQLERWYLVDHLTMEEIGEILGISRQGVFNRFKRCRIDKSSGERFEVNCDYCGRIFSITRKKWRGSRKHFCSHGCHSKYMRNEEFRAYKSGQMMGRGVMEKRLGRGLMDGEVVYHVDGDEGNNDWSNLMLFSSHGEMMKHLHRLRIRESVLPVNFETGVASV